MKRIKLASRYGTKNYLEEVSPNRYKLITEDPYCRFGLNEDGSYYFVDPSGGPFMAVGSEVEGHIIKAIHKGGIIEFES